jgi:formylmethanofuran dehydrogenase subunit B
MVKLVYSICFSGIFEIMKTLKDCVNAALCLAIGLVVVRGGHLELDLQVLHKLVSEV